MAVTAKRLYGNDNAPNTLTTGYTVPASTTTTATYISVANKSTTTQAAVTIKFAGITFLSAVLVDAGTTLMIDDMKVVMSAGEIMQVQSSLASTLAITVNGTEVT